MIDKITTIERLEEEVNKFLLLKDKGVVRVVCASIIANRMCLDPVWLLLVAPSAGGKSELINAVSSLPFMHNISDLTVNTFASGQKRQGKETSLLLKMNNGIMAFKDFTSMISKSDEAKKAIFSQLREIYDGEYTKRTGTGDDIVWRGKIGAIAGVTEVIYMYLTDMSAMGDRFVMYSIGQPDRKEMTRRQIKNSHSIRDKRAHIKECFESYINHVLEQINDEDIKLSKQTEEEIIDIADFATRARSGVVRNFKKDTIEFTPAPEMPTRVTSQLYTMASAFVAMRRSIPSNIKKVINGINQEEKEYLYKIAFDSIPKTRRLCITPLAQYKEGITTVGLATLLDMETMVVKKYLSELNALGICTREATKGGSKGHTWKIREEYRSLVLGLEKLNIIEGSLTSKDNDDYDDYGNYIDPEDDYTNGVDFDSIK